MCLRSKRKMASAINTKHGTHILHDRTSAWTNPMPKGQRSRTQGYKNRHRCTVINGEWVPAVTVCCCCYCRTPCHMTALVSTFLFIHKLTADKITPPLHRLFDASTQNTQKHKKQYEMHNTLITYYLCVVAYLHISNNIHAWSHFKLGRRK